MESLDDLIAFLSSSPTPYHAVASATARLLAAGFEPLAERDPWESLGAGRYYVVHEGSAVVAFVVPEGAIAGYRIVGAHTDSPNLRLKPKPEYAKEGYLQLGVEVYGGALLNSWLDRDLGLAGRVLLRGASGRVETRLVRLDHPRLRVPQLAIHLDREVNEKGLVLNKQEHMAPVLGLQSSGEAEVTALVAAAVGAQAADVVHVDLMLHDTLSPARGGAHDELLFSARLDNLAMCHAGTQAIAIAATTAPGRSLSPVLALFDHEEVGSQSATGAESHFLPRVLERLSRRRGRSFDEHARVLSRSLCLSADMAHAVHPNYEARHEPRHKPVLNGGPVLKVNAQQRYATSARTAAIVEELCRGLDIPLQHYVNRTDLPCGSTIGPITGALLGVPTADVGNPMLSMHSCREMAGAQDPAQMERLMGAFFAFED
jgi:aspartyl aminopeptidase